MKTIKADATIVITGIFRKRYWQIMPGVAVYELPVTTYKKQLEEQKHANVEKTN